MKKFFRDFKAFISRGNIMDMAVGIIIGSAFTAIVTALTNKILMPLINWLLAAIVGGNGLDAIYTFLKKAYTVDGSGNTVVDLANSVYIDWGAFITAIINFFLIALVLFLILKAIMNASNFMKKTQRAYPTKAEKKELKANGVNMKNYKEVIAKTAELRTEKAKAEAEAKAKADEEARLNNPTEADLLKEIRDLLKAQVATAAVEAQEKPARKRAKKSE